MEGDFKINVIADSPEALKFANEELVPFVTQLRECLKVRAEVRNKYRSFFEKIPFLGRLLEVDPVKELGRSDLYNEDRVVAEYGRRKGFEVPEVGYIQNIVDGNFNERKTVEMPTIKMAEGGRYHGKKIVNALYNNDIPKARRLYEAINVDKFSKDFVDSVDKYLQIFSLYVVDQDIEHGSVHTPVDLFNCGVLGEFKESDFKGKADLLRSKPELIKSFRSYLSFLFKKHPLFFAAAMNWICDDLKLIDKSEFMSFEYRKYLMVVGLGEFKKQSSNNIVYAMEQYVSLGLMSDEEIFNDPDIQDILKVFLLEQLRKFPDYFYKWLNFFDNEKRHWIDKKRFFADESVMILFSEMVNALRLVDMDLGNRYAYLWRSMGAVFVQRVLWDDGKAPKWIRKMAKKTELELKKYDAYNENHTMNANDVFFEVYNQTKDGLMTRHIINCAEEREAFNRKRFSNLKRGLKMYPQLRRKVPNKSDGTGAGNDGGAAQI